MKLNKISKKIVLELQEDHYWRQGFELFLLAILATVSLSADVVDKLRIVSAIVFFIGLIYFGFKSRN